MNFHTYIDWTQVQPARPFYVGKGNDDRIKGTVRNRHHAHVARKHGLTREVVLTTSLEKEAFDEEIRLIAELHTFIDDPNYNGIGCNETPGGEGHTPSKEQRARLSSCARARWADPEFKRRASLRMKGKVHASGPRPKQSAAISGSRNPNFGKPMAEATKVKLREAKLGKKMSPRSPEARARNAASRMKAVSVIDAGGTARTFASHKEAASVISRELGLSCSTVLCRLVARHASYRGLTFSYMDAQ